MKIIFMGSPDFTLPVLETLIGCHEIVGIYTQPPRPSGRKMEIHKTAVHEWGEAHNIPVFIPDTLKDTAVQEQMKTLNADAIVVYAYSQLIPDAVLNMTPFGCINIHPSLLPRWRGAAPVIRTVEAGDKETGVSIMKLDKGWDTGPLFAQEQITLNGTETAAEVGAKLTGMACPLLLNILKYQPTPVAQSEQGVTYAKKLDKEELKLNLKEPAEVLERKIRAFGRCYLPIGGKRLYITKAEVVPPLSDASGESDRFNCGDGKALRPLQLYYEGKKSVSIKDFLMGHILPNDIQENDLKKKDKVTQFFGCKSCVTK